MTSNHTYSGRFSLPIDTDPRTYPLEECTLLTRASPIGLGTDGYYGLMVYVPSGFNIANQAFFGVNIMEYHYQGVYSAPVIFQLHEDHITLALETGACYSSGSASPGCAYRSNADGVNPSTGQSFCRSTSAYTCRPGYYAIPPGQFVQGHWNEILMHVHWASDSTGQIQTWYRTMGSSTWNASATVAGIPTVQWNVAAGCCNATYSDHLEAYTSALTAPLSVWLDNELASTNLLGITSRMP